MTNGLRSVAEARFASLFKQDSKIVPADAEQQALRENTARLRALRLARDSQMTKDQTLRLEAKRRDKVKP